MEEALNAAIHAINFVKTNSVNNKFKTLLLHTEAKWLSRGLSLEKFVNLWEQVLNFLKFKSQMADSNYKKQAGKAQEILEKLETAEMKSKISLKQ